MINYQQAYIIGLLIGGGTISDTTFIVNLPYDKWGMDPRKMNVIAVDILTKICERFQFSYQIKVTYEIGNKRWLIKPIGEPQLDGLIADLSEMGLPFEGELINTVDLSITKDKLTGICVESFLSGIFDTRASLTASHRRFSDHAPIVSIEIPGSSKNFKFVVQLCSWLTQLGTTTDQILYNHPCQHAPADPNYGNWSKGFKIRLLVKSFLKEHSFAMQAKAFDIGKLEKNQNKEEQLPCKQRTLEHVTPVSIHSDINSSKLPIEVRNCLFFHYLHICAVMGCPYAPVESVVNTIKKYKSLISAFPRLAKGEQQEITDQFNEIQHLYFPNTNLVQHLYSVENLLTADSFKLYMDLEQGIAYLFSPELNGKRHCGSKKVILDNVLKSEIQITLPNIEGTPILIVNSKNNRAIIVSTTRGKFNQDLVEKLIEVDRLHVKIK